MNLLELRGQTQDRLGDPGQVIWTADEVDGHLVNGYQQIARHTRPFFDWAYLDNLPATFSLTQTWERRYLTASAAAANFDAGVANYTCPDELGLLEETRLQLGPAQSTAPWEILFGHYDAVPCNPAIAALADLPPTLTELDRVTWDKRGIDAMEPRQMSKVDARYEITAGEVYGYMWELDGVFTLRKIRVPAARASTVTADGGFGTLRDPTDLVSVDNVTGWETAGFDAGGFDNEAFEVEQEDTALWGLPRRWPGHHPIGTEHQGISRHFFLEGTNVRAEIYRQGRALDSGVDECELPERYARYLRDYAMSKLLERRGPGQDLALAKHFGARWARGLDRIQRRTSSINDEHAIVMGGDGMQSLTRPPRPKLPWQYGSRVR